MHILQITVASPHIQLHEAHGVYVLARLKATADDDYIRSSALPPSLSCSNFHLLVGAGCLNYHLTIPCAVSGVTERQLLVAV